MKVEVLVWTQIISWSLNNLLTIYVDDTRGIGRLNDELQAEFKVKDLPYLNLFFFGPLHRNWKINLNEEDSPLEKEPYQLFVGKLICLSLSRPDITLSVTVVSQFMDYPTKRYDAVKQILHYSSNGSTVPKERLDERCILLLQGVVQKQNLEE